MRILCTGGNGLVGKAIRRITKNDRDNEWIFIGSSNEVDLTDRYQTRKYFKNIKPDVVIHLAGSVLGGHTSGIDQFNVLVNNSQIDVNVFESCSIVGVKKIIACLTVVMSDDDVITTDSIINGPSFINRKHFGYKNAKRLLHSLCISYREIGESIIFCPVNIYGYDDLNKSDRLIPSLYRKMRDNKSIDIPMDMEKSFIYNEDLASVIVNSIYMNEEIYEPIIVGGDSLSIGEVCGIIHDTLCIGEGIEIPDTKKSSRIEYNYKQYFPEFNPRSFKDGMNDIYLKINAPINQQNIKNISLGEFITTQEIKENISDVLGSGRLSYGKYSKDFEEAFAKAHDCKFGILSNSGTSSLQVALGALKEKYKWKDGDEIIVPAITFVASVNVILQNNLKPVFVDVDPLTYNMDPAKIEEKISDKTKGIMVVHLFGQISDIDPIVNICKKHGLKLVEDSCETMFTRRNYKSVGSFGDISCFSTYNAHLLITGVGGLSLTNDPELAMLMRSLVNHGRNNIYISIDDDNPQSSNFQEIIDKRFVFERVGYSYRVTEMEAAIGLSQMDTIENNIAQRRENAKYLTEKLSELSMLQLPYIIEDHVFMMYPIVILGDYKKDTLVAYLEKNGIETRNLMPITNQPVYKELLFADVDVSSEYPVAENLNNKGFYIGCHCFLDKDDLDYVVDTFKNYFKDEIF
jgi:dTDP-4-amino-4,6-dideoxygalactose transaminase/nucleoside-diphosphate-sugar epimerase